MYVGNKAVTKPFFKYSKTALPAEKGVLANFDVNPKDALQSHELGHLIRSSRFVARKASTCCAEICSGGLESCPDLNRCPRQQQPVSGAVLLEVRVQLAISVLDPVPLVNDQMRPPDLAQPWPVVLVH